MRKHKFIAYFKNGKSLTVYAGSTGTGVIIASAQAIDRGWDYRIDKIYDETDKKWYNKVVLAADYHEVTT
jgi:hypothetical protein